MKHLTELLAAAGVTTLALTSCDSGEGTAASQSGGAGDTTSFKTCAVSDADGWDDKSLNESACEDLKASQMSLGTQINTAEFNSGADFSPNVEFMVSDGCNPTIGVGLNLEKAVRTSTDGSRGVHYALIDSSFNDGNSNTVTLDNARPLLFDTTKAAYLAGYVVVGMTETDKTVAFGDIQIPSMTVFMDDFVDGVATYNKAKGTNIQLLGWDKVTQNGSLTQSFDGQMLGKEQAQQFIFQDTDITTPVVGPTGPDAAAATRVDGDTWIISVDSDWYETNPDCSSTMPTSVMREIGAPAGQAAQDSVNGKFSSTSYVGTLANGGVSIVLFHDLGDKVSAELKADLTKLTDDIRPGKLVIESQSALK